MSKKVRETDETWNCALEAHGGGADFKTVVCCSELCRAEQWLLANGSCKTCIASDHESGSVDAGCGVESLECVGV
jgi:hypothetical protein